MVVGVSLTSMIYDASSNRLQGTILILSVIDHAKGGLSPLKAKAKALGPRSLLIDSRNVSGGVERAQSLGAY